MEFLFNKTFGMLSGMLGYRSQRNKVIMSNIANMDSPDYKPKDYVFKSDLDRAIEDQNSLALAKTDKNHLPAVQDEISDKNFKVVETGDKVKMDEEMTSLAENHLMYNLTVEMLARKFKGLNTVLKETK
ncbi:MAG: Flagellar basal body rod protein FlgB [Syntrophus sp. PtaU1.Bin208]|nr:MAG: Flagellar basal body rod protein FlgB [Syntrophus sp. PtaU1.Bin208]